MASVLDVDMVRGGAVMHGRLVGGWSDDEPETLLFIHVCIGYTYYTWRMYPKGPVTGIYACGVHEACLLCEYSCYLNAI